MAASWMAQAMQQAEQAGLMNEVPVGAIVVLNDACIAAAHNAPISQGLPTAHAEVLALNAAARAIGNYRLPGAVVYVTLEPCLMCYGAMVHARIARCYYAAPDPKSGIVSTGLFTHVAQVVNHRVDCLPGSHAEEAGALLRHFFQQRRR